MGLVRNGRTRFQNPGSYSGSDIKQTGNWIKGGLRNRFVGGVSQTFGAYPNGHLAPNAFILPGKSGSISSYTLSRGSITGSASLTPGTALVASGSCAISATNAQLDIIVPLVATGSGAIAVVNADLSGIASATATGSCAITQGTVICGALFSVTASASGSVSGTGSTLTAIAHMEAEAGGPTELSPEGLADAVWDELLTDHQNAGSAGEALSDAGAAGNPWSALLVDNQDAGTFGERVQKLLTLTKYLGLK